MKAILMSIHPKWAEKIFDGEKTIEVRKTSPKLKTPFKVYVYCTKGKPYLYKNPNSGELFLDNNDGYRGGDYEDRYLTGKVIGLFVCDRVDEYDYHKGIVKFGGELGLPIGTFDTYFIFEDDYRAMCLSYDEIKDYGMGKPLYGWHITETKLFDKPRELDTFWAVRCTNKKGYCSTCKVKPACKDNITRPPQSWCYVEEER